MANKFVNTKSIQDLQSKSNLGNYQITAPQHKGVTYQPVTYTTLNPVQSHLYHRALYGLSVFSQEEIMTMNKEKRKRIIKVHKKTKRVLNIWKQQLVVAYSNSLFRKLFPKSSLTKELCDSFSDELDPEFKCYLNLKDFGVSKEQIIERLLSEKILPQNFYQLKA